MEELVAEIASCFICHEAGIMDKKIDNSASYIGSGRIRSGKY
jgi:antirestriction protein ArdC